MAVDFADRLHDHIVAALTKDYPAMLAHCAGTPRACALVTDGNAMTLFFAVDVDVDADADAGQAVRWSPCEWGCGDHLLADGQLRHVSD